jgi:hypothetical protein
MLIVSIIFDPATLQVDYTAAFVHAYIDKPPNWETMTELEKERSGVCIEMPRGFGENGKILKLKKSLYGLKMSPRKFFLHLKGKLEKFGFTQSENDPCLFMNDKVICIVYVDDTLFYSPKESFIQVAIEALRQENMELEVESDVAGFLGVLITKKPDGTIHLTHTGLIKRILAALNMADFTVFQLTRTEIRRKELTAFQV